MTWPDRFDELRDLPADVAERLNLQARIIRLAPGSQVFAPGQQAANMLLVLGGTVRVQQTSDTGRDVYLYRVHAGESCILTTACMLADEIYSAEAITETEVEAVAIPRQLFDELLTKSARFRQFVLQGYARRIADLLSLIDDIVFHRVDVRLATRLLELAREDRVAATHQALAVELGTAREVISRGLGEFQRRGWVETGRGEIRILNRDKLEKLVRSVT